MMGGGGLIEFFPFSNVVKRKNVLNSCRNFKVSFQRFFEGRCISFSLLFRNDIFPFEFF